MVFGFLGGYVQEEGIATGARYFLLEQAQKIPGLQALPNAAYYLFCAAVFAAIIVWCWRTVNRQTGGAASRLRGDAAFLPPAFALAAALMFLFSPHYAWYLLWLLPFFTLMPNLPILAYLLGFFYLYTTALAAPGPKMFQANQILYTGVLAAVVIQFVFLRWPIHRSLFVQPAAASEAL